MLRLYPRLKYLLTMEPLSTTNTELITEGKAQIYTKYITKD
jgi:hypothetical protein